MKPTTITVDGCRTISHAPPLVPSTKPLRPRHARRWGAVGNFLRAFLRAMQESRAEQARREIDRHRHLLTPKVGGSGEVSLPHPNASAGYRVKADSSV
jgi:hypothetical protein